MNGRDISYFFDEELQTLVGLEVEEYKKRHKPLASYAQKENKSKSVQLTVQPAVYDSFSATAKSLSFSVNKAFMFAMMNFIEKKDKPPKIAILHHTKGQNKSKRVQILIQPELHTHFKEVAEDSGYKINQALMLAMIYFIVENNKKEAQ